MSETQTLRFGNFELDPIRRELRCEGIAVRIQPRVFELLRFLALNPDRAISRTEILERVWKNATVADGSLSKAVRVLRSTLSPDPALAHTIQTVRGFGYRFCLPLESPGDSDSPAAPAVAASDPLPTPTDDPPLVSREPALFAFFSALQAARAGTRQTIWIEGEPGTGKTMLARSALERIDGDPSIGIGQCLEGFGVRSPYLPILEALVHLGLSGDELRRARSRDLIARAAPNWRGHLPALFPDHDSAVEPIQPQLAEMARELLDAFELLARESPVIVVVEDFQWADESSIQLVESLSRRGLPSSLLIVLTVRPSEGASRTALKGMRAELVKRSGITLIEMTPLTPDGIRALTEWRLRQTGCGPDVPIETLLDWLGARSQGHPLFLVQLMDHIASLGLLADWNDDGDSLRRVEAAGLPKTLGKLLSHWVAALDPRDRKFLETASVAGFVFDTRMIEAALGLDSAESEEIVDRLSDAGWLEWRAFIPWPDGSRGMQWQFRHALFAEALCQDIPPGRLRRLHHEIARRLDLGYQGQPIASSELGEHYERAAVLDEAARHHARAAVFAASRQSVAEAIAHAESAMRLLPALPEHEQDLCEMDLCLSIGSAVALREGYGSERAKQSFERARNLAHSCDDATREAAAIWGVASCSSMRGEIADARIAGERLLELAEGNDDPRFQLLARDVLCNLAFFQGRFADCIEHRDATLALSHESRGANLPVRSLEDVQANSHVYAGMAHWHLGQIESAIHSIDEALKLARQVDRPQTRAIAEAFASILYYLLGDSEKQRLHASQAREICEASGIGLWLEISRFMETYADEPSESGLLDLQSTLRAMSRYGGLGGTLFIGLLAEWEAALGNPGKARELCDLAIDTAHRTSERHHLPALYLTRASVAETAIERTESMARAEAAARRIESVSHRHRILAAGAESPSESPRMRRSP